MTPMTETVELERYFYHSFPRRGRDEKVEAQRGLKILELIRDFGLLLTPEITAWEYPHADGSPPRSIEGITYAITPPEMLSLALEGTMNLFYFADADETRENSALKYYRQREWRVAGNIGRMGEELMGLPSSTLIDRLLALDPEFFGREFPRQGAVPTNPSLTNRSFGKRLIDWVFVYQGIDERHIVGAARRVIVPREAMEAAKGILSKHFKHSSRSWPIGAGCTV
jgi:hypothetical protein